jgi:hypothetical protein
MKRHFLFPRFSFLAACLCLGVALPARADIVLDPSTVSGEYLTIGYAEIAASDGPHFSALPPVPGITGLSVTGSADVIYVDTNAGGQMMLEFGGPATGVMTDEVIHVSANYIFTPHWSTPPGMLFGNYIYLDLYFNRQYLHATGVSFFDTSSDRPVNASFAFDMSFPGAAGTEIDDFLVRLTMSPDDPGQLGDGFSFALPTGSLDIGVAPNAVPEPSTMVLSIVAGAAAIPFICRVGCRRLLRGRMRVADRKL